MNLMVQKNLNGIPTRFHEKIICQQLLEKQITASEIEAFRQSFILYQFDLEDLPFIEMQKPKHHTARPLTPNYISHTALLSNRWKWLYLKSGRPVLVWIESNDNDIVKASTLDNKKIYLSYAQIERNGSRFSIPRYYPGLQLEPCVWSGQPYHSPPVRFSNTLTLFRVDYITVKWKQNIKFKKMVFSKFPVIKINDVTLLTDQVVNFVMNDGFQTIDHMSQFFTEDFSGQLLTWGTATYHKTSKSK